MKSEHVGIPKHNMNIQISKPKEYVHDQGTHRTLSTQQKLQLTLHSQ